MHTATLSQRVDVCHKGDLVNINYVGNVDVLHKRALLDCNKHNRCCDRSDAQVALAALGVFGHPLPSPASVAFELLREPSADLIICIH
jgi:hypothetical protein